MRSRTDNGKLPSLERRWPNNVAALRKDRGLDTKTLAERSGIPAPTMFGIQSGRLQLTQERVSALRQVLDCKPEDLFVDGKLPVRLPSDAEARSRRGKAQPHKPQEDDVTTERLVTQVLAFPRRRRGALLRLLDTLQKDWT